MEKTRRLPAIFFIMMKIGLFTFGGGWSIIAQIQNEFVDKKGWMTEEQIVDYMSLAKSFPGIMIINMSVFCGYTMAGPAGAVAAAFGLSLPALSRRRARSVCARLRINRRATSMVMATSRRVTRPARFFDSLMASI